MRRGLSVSGNVSVYSNAGKIAFAVFLVVGVCLIIIGGIWGSNELKFKENSVETTGVITKIETYRSGGKENHDVFVSYTVGDKQYENNLGYWSSGMKEGQQVTICYDPANPDTFSGSGGIIFPIIVFTLGLAFFIIGGASLYSLRKRGDPNTHQ